MLPIGRCVFNWFLDDFGLNAWNWSFVAKGPYQYKESFNWNGGFTRIHWKVGRRTRENPLQFLKSYEKLTKIKRILIKTKFLFCRILNNNKIILSGPMFCQLLSYVTTITINILILDRVSLIIQFLIIFIERRRSNHWFFWFVQSFSIANGQNLLIIGLNALCAQTAYTWILCYYASETTTKYNLFALEAYKAGWYYFTAAEQRVIWVIINFGQQEIQFTGFNIINCSLATFALLYTLHCRAHRCLCILPEHFDFSRFIDNCLSLSFSIGLFLSFWITSPIFFFRRSLYDQLYHIMLFWDESVAWNEYATKSNNKIVELGISRTTPKTTKIVGFLKYSEKDLQSFLFIN